MSTEPKQMYQDLLSSLSIHQQNLTFLQKRLQQAHQQKLMTEGSLQTLEKLHEFNREEIIKELAESDSQEEKLESVEWLLSHVSHSSSILPHSFLPLLILRSVWICMYMSEKILRQFDNHNGKNCLTLQEGELYNDFLAHEVIHFLYFHRWWKCQEILDEIKYSSLDEIKRICRRQYTCSHSLG